MVGGRRQARGAAVQAIQTPARPTAPAAPQQKLQQAGAGIVQLYRYPGLTQSKAKTLLRKAQDKASPSITAIDGELCYNIALTAPLTPAEAETLAWLLRETFEPELLTGGTEFPASAVGPDDIVVEEMGLAFDEWDLDYYTQMFRDELGRDPTNVELFDIAQSNSEHSSSSTGRLAARRASPPQQARGRSRAGSTLEANKGNSVIGFKDNSSAIRGGAVTPLLPATPGGPAPLAPQPRDWDVLLTAETHNFPCAVAPYPGAETGAGGRIRDTHATGIGSMMGAASAGYCVGNLRMEGYEQPWEDPSFEYPASLAPPLQILVDASNGASDYGNKFGEPLVCGYTRTFGQRLAGGERREWIKPIMFSGGLGQIDHAHLYKNDPEIGMLVVKIGGPAYRIGMGGGAASSVPSGSNSADLDFNAVQRGDAEVSQKLWRVVRACVELGDVNPIEQIHDQGAGGNCNVVKEIIYPLGAQIDVRAVRLGDQTLSVLEIWGAEYQENDCLLIRPEARATLEGICARERCLMQGTTAAAALDRVLRLPAVDRSVTGLIAQQQCCGPLQLPVADVAVMAQTHFGLTGAATAIGEQPIKVLTPDLKAPGASRLLHVDLAAGRRRLGGSALAQAYGQVGDACPDVDPALLGAAFNATQRLIAEGRLLAGHDISDGGIATAILEMAFAGNCGVAVDLPAPAADPHGELAVLFAEELGWVLEVSEEQEAAVLAAYVAAGVPCAAIGASRAGAEVSVAVGGGTAAIAGTTPALRDTWEATSFQLERLQCAEENVEAEASGLAARAAPTWRLPYTPAWTPPDKLAATGKVRVAILREEGSNGDREMAAAVWAAGMEPWDLHMSDLLAGGATLDDFQGLVFVGGFSYADVMDSAKGWAGTIRFNDRLWSQFQRFYARPDTFSLGVCNGCQLMALLGWVPASGAAAAAGGGAEGAAPLLEDARQPRFVHNASGRFESRWAMVRVEEGSPAVMLRGMAGAQLGVWCAHGEGRAHFPDAAVRARVEAEALAPIRYCDAKGAPTEQYPFNPNGSPAGIAALCSPDGRHLAMMPHPERCFLAWQLPWYPRGMEGLEAACPGPWLKLFQNAREWCEAQA
ncbi:hypothetical protein CHLNCDRAFT_139160 [Chlorella variabilis]|uniref:Uncharacterized protein n=1 Tax=Chlorella variabilis TaxID=554065 RepID=E1ZPK6_CHLVA|nr:hypothetical protein CHLNCDRAFT_139160 [Chlorella variabilis]EFN52340.1 hypothetical protein CHLNCDRAFT_139160 [Chlorella variabilis]|eukprot:XP_005844442.1 hypothetical protein CHLNCDRAFT_139160 [Chlorella variabilis]